MLIFSNKEKTSKLSKELSTENVDKKSIFNKEVFNLLFIINSRNCQTMFSAPYNVLTADCPKGWSVHDTK